MAFLMENISTIIIALILAGMVYAVIRKMIRDKKEGKGCGCSGGCAGCGGASMCHGGHTAGKGKQA
ncbi:MAG: FeoB-associated Cys-rich membrane protein [Enterocloster asparagiformis]|nr:FeoB-associated Cys-rich membrane protein [Enterocloster asparagiformis]